MAAEDKFNERKKRVTITPDILRRIRKGIDKHQSVKEIAEKEELTVQTVYKYVTKICDISDQEILETKKGRKVKEFTMEKSKVSTILMRDSSFTQKELSEQLADDNLIMSTSSVCRLLKKMEYTRKRLVKIPEERNSARIIDIRQNYAREIQFVSDVNLVFLDETGVNLHHSKHYGYSPKNVKAIKTVKGGRGRNISCMLAIKITGIVNYTIKEGAFNGDSFLLFIEEKLAPHFANYPYDVLIMDNCSFHHRKDVTQLLNSKNISHRFLPAYSPQLSSIEEYFSHMKSVLSSNHTQPQNTEELKSRIVNILTNETINFNGWFANMRRYIDKALARQKFI